MEVFYCFYYLIFFAVPKNIRLNSMHSFIMKISYIRELQQCVSHHTLDIEFQDSMNLYKKRTAKPYSFLVIDTTLASDNPLRFRNNLLEKIYKVIMTIDHKIRHKKTQYDINREAAKNISIVILNSL